MDRQELAKMHDKRQRSPKEALEDPVMESIEGRSDDNHTTFNWDSQRKFKNPNQELSTYWAEAKYMLGTC